MHVVAIPAVTLIQNLYEFRIEALRNLSQNNNFPRFAQNIHPKVLKNIYTYCLGVI